MRGGIFSILLIAVAAAAQARQAPEVRPALIVPGGMPVFFSTEGPLAYRPLTRSEIPKEAMLIGRVTGQSCQYSLAIPLSFSARGSSVSGAIGNGTYNKILAQMEKEHPGLRGIFDAKIDLHSTSILGIFGKLCSEIDAQGYR